jgi:hypothetical protein
VVVALLALRSKESVVAMGTAACGESISTLQEVVGNLMKIVHRVVSVSFASM